MMIFRLSQKLSTKIKAGPLPMEPLHENVLADWSARLFVRDRTQYIVLSNTKSLYSTVMFGTGITNTSQFIARALSNIREFMMDDGKESAWNQFIAPATDSIRFAKALNRSVTGSMNDLIIHATAWLCDGDVAPHDVGVRLNDILLSVIASSDSPYGRPQEAFELLLRLASVEEVSSKTVRRK